MCCSCWKFVSAFILKFQEKLSKVKIYIAFSSEIRLNTHFKSNLTNYTKSDMLTKILVLLPVDWNKNGLLFTKRLHKTNKFIGNS